MTDETKNGTWIDYSDEDPTTFPDRPGVWDPEEGPSVVVWARECDGTELWARFDCDYEGDDTGWTPKDGGYYIGIVAWVRP